MNVTYIIEHIVLALGAEFTADERERIERIPTNSIQAYMLYLKARTLMY